MAQIFETIKAKLLEIEKEENVRIFYACESGSRAWGFPSVNSDYDVRFLYIREQNFYLSIDVEDKRDVIEVPIDDELDINGWDLRKALRLLRKSNPPLLEWLSSPTVYLEEEELIKKFRSLVPLSYSPTACMYHYMQMARNSFREYLKGDEVSVKKYFYVLRPLLAIKWIEERSDVVPMEFGIMIDALLHDSDLKSQILKLIERKRKGEEMSREPKIPAISGFIETEMDRLKDLSIPRRDEKPLMKTLNDAFREIVNRSAIRDPHSTF
ncbi:MAG TPA: nucleotidyltransferase domain-containing protein [Pyrinomonadaceae bacterium]|nr:nucleotidyltransferase domain-containing protein [Pyrinomonadaceae bacterium]